MKKKKYLEIAVISFFATALVMALFIGFANVIDSNDSMHLINYIIMTLAMTLIIYVPGMLMFFFGMFSFKLGKKVTELEAVDFNFFEDKNYYRDILKNYSIVELAYINDMSTLKEKDVIASILGLELKKVIKLENNNIISVDRSKITTKAEEYILMKSITGKVRIDSLETLTDCAKKDALQNGLIQKEKNVGKDILWMFIKTNIFTFVSILFLVLSTTIMDAGNEIISIILSLIILALMLFSSVRWLYLLSYIYHKLRAYELTEKGKEIRNKLQGLKRYINDFGNLQDNEKESLILWEDYLIYSVIFETNDVIINQMKDIIEVKSRTKLSKKTIFIIVFVLTLLYLFLN